MYPRALEPFLQINWLRQDLLAALAHRLPENHHRDIFDLLDDDLSPAGMGLTDEHLDYLIALIRPALEDVSIERGWEIIEDTLLWELGSAEERLEQQRHPNQFTLPPQPRPPS